MRTTQWLMQMETPSNYTPLAFSSLFSAKIGHAAQYAKSQTDGSASMTEIPPSTTRVPTVRE
jgi:hypothetical protein